jgi:hypothetical protein
MTRDEVIEGLRVAVSAVEFPDDVEDALREAIKLLTPEPVSDEQVQAAREFLATMLQNDPTERATMFAFDALAELPKLKTRIREYEAETAEAWAAVREARKEVADLEADLRIAKGASAMNGEQVLARTVENGTLERIVAALGARLDRAREAAYRLPLHDSRELRAILDAKEPA